MMNEVSGLDRICSRLPAVALWLLCSVAVAQGDDAEAHARKSLKAAEELYLGTDFEGADVLLGAAIDKCGEDSCKQETLALLHVLHAEVLVSGLSRPDEARVAMRRALEMNPKLKLNAEVDSQALFEIYDEVKAEGDDDDESPEPQPEDPDEPEEPKEEIRRNWIRVAFMVDLQLRLAESDVCSPLVRDGEGWVCSRTDDSVYLGVPTIGQQDSVPTAMKLATMRATVGYERVLGDNFTLGLRAGYVFRPLRGGNDDDFIPVHVEGRAAYWFGASPFHDIVRPNLFIAGGLGQSISGSSVTVVEDGGACGAEELISGDCTRPTDPERSDPEARVQGLTANKLSGPGFAGLGFGLSFSPTPLLMIDTGVRISATFPVFSLLVTPEAGVSFGF